jgi:hypothetical protein
MTRDRTIFNRRRPLLIRLLLGGRRPLFSEQLLQDWLGHHRSIQHTVHYTELAPTRFKDFWRD